MDERDDYPVVVSRTAMSKDSACVFQFVVFIT